MIYPCPKNMSKSPVITAVLVKLDLILSEQFASSQRICPIRMIPILIIYIIQLNIRFFLMMLFKLDTGGIHQ